VVSPQGRCEQVELACQRGLSQRRAFGLIGVVRSALSYALRTPAKDAPVIEAMRSLAVPALRIRAHSHLPSTTGVGIGLVQCSSLVATGWTAGAQEVGTQTHCHRKASSEHVVDDEHGLGIHGAPLFLRSDNGPEFVSHAILEWITNAGIGTSLSDPGKPWRNGTDESFNGKFRDECLSLEWFSSRREACVGIEARRRHYETVRPHSSLGNMTPTSSRSNIIQNPTGPSYRNEWLEKPGQVRG
jgi:hypothetical protein